VSRSGLADNCKGTEQARSLTVLLLDEAVGKTPGDRIRAVLNPR
jgi:hypothetical protein